MHSNQTSNSIVVDNPEQLPFPSEIAALFPKVKWEELEWRAIGLPAFNSSFSLSNKQLYFEADENGKPSLQKQEDFTGQAIIDCVIVPEESLQVYVVAFELTFHKGVLDEAVLIHVEPRPRAEYEAGFQEYLRGQMKTERMLKSFWFKYLYRPYFFVVKVVVTAVVFVMTFLLRSFVWCADQITPIKP